MTIYVSDTQAERLKKLADDEKRKISEQLEILLDAYEKRNDEK